MAIEYKIEETTAVIVNGDDVKDWETIPAFQVQRVESNMAWAVAKYRDEKVALAVKTLLELFAGDEAP